MLTKRDITFARVATLRWMAQMANDIPKIWDAGFHAEAISTAQIFNAARDVTIKLGEMKDKIDGV